ncbi:MAG: ATP-binding cassette domain-containing protein [Streptococcaceae bacterium]|jgi:ABC-type lipoprotein export system ATPase subunit/ABC-type antimicrobial peptide transport system permease subunit|nr:ATP-binding cassette domain-containing protein [Streptococcaceae bacterium]
MTILELKNIKKSYFLGKEEFPVLKGIDLSFERGDFVSLLGESGGGKSTLMNIIGGLDRKYDGDVLIDGVAQKSKKEKDMDAYRRDTIGFIFQSFNLVNYLSVLDNVLISLKMTKLSDKQRHERAIELIKQVGLYEHRKKKTSQLSGGQKQRVAIARALAADPEIILADEPTGALDSQNTKEVLAILRSIAESGKTVIVVTHSQEVADYGTRIIRLADGKITGDERIKPTYGVTDSKRLFESKNLSYRDVIRTSFQHFIHTWKLNLLISIGTAIGLFAVIFFLGLGNGGNQYMNKMITDMANPNVPTVYRRVSTDQTLSNDQALGEASQAIASGNKDASFTDDLIQKLKNLDHVKEVEPGFSFPSSNSSIEFSDGKKASFTQLVTYTNMFSDSSIIKGNIPKDGEVAIQENLAETFDKENPEKAIGQTITVTFMAFGENGPVNVTSTMKISGIMATTRQAPEFVSTFATLKTALSDANAYTQANNVTLTIDQVKNVKPTVEKIQNIKIDGKKAFVTFSLGDVLDQITNITGIVSTVLAAIAGVSLIVSIFMIIVTTYMSVAERTKEIGILRAMGGRKKDISRLFTAESLILGLFSAAIAIVLAKIAQVAINTGLHSLVGGNIVVISSAHILFAVIIAVIIALLSSLAPSSRAARLNTIEALASE